MKYFIFLLGISTLHAAPLDFFSSLEAIKNKNTKSEAAEKEEDFTKARRLEAYAQFLPSLSLSAYRTKDYRPEDKGEIDSFYLNSSMNLFRFGADIYGIKAAHSYARLGAEKRAQTNLFVESQGFDVLSFYIFYEQNLLIFDQSLKIKEDYYETSKKRSERALITDQEVNKIFIDLSNLRAQREDTYLLFLKARADLVTLLESEEVKLNWPLRDFFMNLDSKKFLNQNLDWQEAPTYRISVEERDQNQANLTKSKLAFLPTVDLSFSTGYDKYKALGLKDYDTRAILSLTIPLFEKLSDYSSYKGQVFSYYRSLGENRELGRGLKERLKEKKEGLLVALKAAREREEVLKIARKLYQNSLGFFNQGRISVDALQRDQERLLASENLTQRAWLATHQSYKDFCHLLGLELKRCGELF